MAIIVYAVMVTDESGNVFQYGGRDEVFSTFDGANSFSDHLRDIHPACKAYPITLIRRAK